MKKSSSSRLSREELDKLYLVLVYLTLAQSKFNFSLFFFFPLFFVYAAKRMQRNRYIQFQLNTTMHLVAKFLKILLIRSDVTL